MIEFFSGAVTLGFLVAAGFFVRFWRKTADRLFLAFAFAFVLFALNQALVELAHGGDRARQPDLRAARAGLHHHPGRDRRQERPPWPLIR